MDVNYELITYDTKCMALMSEELPAMNADESRSIKTILPTRNAEKWRRQQCLKSRQSRKAKWWRQQCPKSQQPRKEKWPKSAVSTKGNGASTEWCKIMRLWEDWAA